MIFISKNTGNIWELIPTGKGAEGFSGKGWRYFATDAEIREEFEFLGVL